MRLQSHEATDEQVYALARRATELEASLRELSSATVAALPTMCSLLEQRANEAAERLTALEAATVSLPRIQTEVAQALAAAERASAGVRAAAMSPRP